MASIAEKPNNDTAEAGSRPAAVACKRAYYLYMPSDFIPTYKVGELVFVFQGASKPYERAIVCRPLATNRKDKYYGRIQVRYVGGSKSTYNVRPKNMIRVVDTTLRGNTEQKGSSTSHVIVTSETVWYRRLAHAQGFLQDVALEIGCDFGPTTKILGEKCSEALGVDKKYSHVLEAIKTHEKKGKVHFHCVDIFEQPDKILGKYGHMKPSIVFVDINGNRMLETVQKAIALVENLFSPRLIVVKSMELFANLAYGDGRINVNKTSPCTSQQETKETPPAPYSIVYM